MTFHSYTAGEITKIQKDVIEGLPLANKAAYRRFLLKVTFSFANLNMSLSLN